jgi:hypothetical protein
VYILKCLVFDISLQREKKGRKNSEALRNFQQEIVIIKRNTSFFFSSYWWSKMDTALKNLEPIVVALRCSNTSTWEAEAGGLWVQGQLNWVSVHPGLYTQDPVSKHKNKATKKKIFFKARCTVNYHTLPTSGHFFSCQSYYTMSPCWSVHSKFSHHVFASVHFSLYHWNTRKNSLFKSIN